MKYFAVITFWLSFFDSSISQNFRAITVSAIFENDTLYAFDPWKVEISIVNTGNETVKIFPISAGQGCINRLGSLDLEIQSVNDSVWRSTRQILNYHDEHGLTIKTVDRTTDLKPKGAFTMTYLLPPILTLADGESINVRLSYFLPVKGDNIYSSAQTIFLKKYSDGDNLAYQYLRVLPRPSFFYHSVFPVQSDFSDIAHAEYIVNNFPESRFSVYCNLFLAQRYLGVARLSAQKGNTTQALEFLRKSKNYSHVVLGYSDFQFTKQSEETLRMSLLFLYELYESEPPISLIQEFTYPPKN